MGPVFLNEYRSRSEYYDEWLKEQSGEKLPETLEDRHRLLMELRQDAYDKLCDAVYEEKGYNSNAIPLPETVERFGLLDEKAAKLLKKNGF